jgi:hypothetical protein
MQLDKYSDLIETATAAGIGFLAYVKTSTAKFEGQGGLNSTNYTLFSKGRVEDSIALFIGSNNMGKIDKSYLTNGATARPNQAFPNPLKAFNFTTYAGVAVLLADKILKETVPNKYYKSLPAIPQFVHGAGIGLLVGGIIGGIWDPDPTANLRPGIPNSAPYAPSPRATISQVGLSWS